MAYWVVLCCTGTWVLIWGQFTVIDDEHCWLWSSWGIFISMAGDMHQPHTCFSISWQLRVFLCNVPNLFAALADSLPLEQCLVAYSTFRKWTSSCQCFKVTAQKRLVTIRVRIWGHLGIGISQQWSLGRWAAGLKCYPIHLPKKKKEYMTVCDTWSVTEKKC